MTKLILVAQDVAIYCQAVNVAQLEDGRTQISLERIGFLDDMLVVSVPTKDVHFIRVHHEKVVVHANLSRNEVKLQAETPKGSETITT